MKVNFAKTFLDKLNFDIYVFEWSGSNSHSARIEAGLRLAENIAELRENGARDVWLMGHSHGGNVALYALRDPELAAVISGIMFLGTPFLHVIRRSVERFAQIFTSTISWLILFPGLLPILPTTLITLIGINYVFPILIIDVLLIFSYFAFRSLIFRLISTSISSLLKRRQDKMLAWLFQPQPICPTFIASIFRDEAGMILKVADLISTWPWAMFGFIASVAGSMIISFLAMMMASLPLYGDTVDELNATEALFMYLSGIPIFLCLAPFLSLLINVSVRGVSFGFEGFLSSSTVHIVPTKAPGWAQDNRSTFYKVKLQNLWALRHSSFYRDMDLLQKCALWIQEPGRVKISERNAADGYDLRHPKQFTFARLRWILPLCASLLVLASYNVLTLSKIAWVSKEQTIGTSFAELTRGIEPRVAFEFHDSVAGVSSGSSTTLVDPISFELDTVLDSGQACALELRFRSENWGTIVNVSLHNLSDAHYGASRFDTERPNRVKKFYDFFDQTNFSELVEWGSNQGSDVTISKYVTNGLSNRARVWVRLWNMSRSPVNVEAKILLSCR